MLVVAVVLLRFPLVPMAFIGGAGDEDASFSRSPSRSPMGAGPQAAVKEKEGEKEFVQQLDEDEKGQQDQETVGERRPFWSSLAEQWGLLGLLVGIVVAFTGTGVLDNSMLDTVLDPMQETISSGGVQAGVASAGSALGSIFGGVGDVASFEETAAGVEEAVAAVGGAEAVEGALAEAAVEGGEATLLDSGLDVVVASTFGALGGLAGVIVQGIKDHSLREALGFEQFEPSGKPGAKAAAHCHTRTTWSCRGAEKGRSCPVAPDGWSSAGESTSSCSQHSGCRGCFSKAEAKPRGQLARLPRRERPLCDVAPDATHRNPCATTS